ncbi:MAG: hypothetical protein Q8K65_00140 [Alphaproteobacteria bacterium]|nr:hypothetical protein [Alphaproteobacteria bacterium]
MATENDQKISPGDKKISELTSDDMKALRVPVGFPGLPYPMAEVRKASNGKMEHVVQVIETAGSMAVYSEQSPERVNGILYRQMPTPSMMLMLRDLLGKIRPDSKNRIMTIFGDASSGKSHIFRMVGGLVHPEGPIMVDCGGMNMRELFFRTVIDYGKGVKEQFEQRVSQGRVSQKTLDDLEEAFPGSIVRKLTNKFFHGPDTEENAKFEKTNGFEDAYETKINWDAIGQRRTEQDGDKTVAVEDRGDAIIRAQKVMEAIYAREGIDTQTNAFGIKTIPGEVFESIRTGRPLFLDEFNKSKRGTLDKFQTFLEFANGQRDYVTINNDMSEAGEGGGDSDSPKSITVYREDLKVGWHIGIAGNDTADGDTTQELSISMEDRLKPHRIGEPEDRDWKHRISQVWTGLPLVTLYNLFEDLATAKPAEFGDWLVQIRKLGLTAAEQKAIPPHEIYFLQNFQETVKAVNQYSDYLSDRAKLSNPESELLADKKYVNMADEVMAGARKVRVSFRTVIDDYNHAVQSTPEVRSAKVATLTLNAAAAFKALNRDAISEPAPAWYRFGANLARKVQESIVNDTVGMPVTQATLIALCEQNGIFPPDFKEAKLSGDKKPIAELLKYDSLKDMGGTDELLEIRGVLMANLRGVYGNIQKQDDFVIPLENLGRAINSMKSTADSGPKVLVLPNEDLNAVNGAPLLQGEAVPSYDMDDSKLEPGGSHTLVDYRSVLAALAVPAYAEQNRARIWPDELLECVDQSEHPKTEEDIEAYNSLQGRSRNGLDLTVLAAGDSKKEKSFMYVLEDKQRSQMIVIGTEEIAPQLKSALSKNGVQYVVHGDETAIVAINEFVSEGAKLRVDAGAFQTGQTQNAIEGLIKAFSAVCELRNVKNEDGQMKVKKGSTLGQIIHGDHAEPKVYTNIIKPR